MSSTVPSSPGAGTRESAEKVRRFPRPPPGGQGTRTIENKVQPNVLMLGVLTKVAKSLVL